MDMEVDDEGDWNLHRWMDNLKDDVEEKGLRKKQMRDSKMEETNEEIKS